MTGLANLMFEELRGVPVARISGEIDASNANEVGERLTRHVSNQPPGMVIDVSETRYFDSACVRLLFDAAKRLDARGQKLRVVAAPESFGAEVLKAVRLEDKVPIDSTVGEAVDALAPPP
jgi:anti-anti-sigma factor